VDFAVTIWFYEGYF